MLNSYLLDEEVDLNEIIICDTYKYAIEEQCFTTYFCNDALIDTKNEKQYFEFFIANFELKQKKLQRIGIPLGIDIFPSAMKNFPITKEYFMKNKTNKN
jgi:hypothetical protein